MFFLKVSVDLKQLFVYVAHAERFSLFVRLVYFKLELEQWVQFLPQVHAILA